MIKTGGFGMITVGVDWYQWLLGVKLGVLRSGLSDGRLFWDISAEIDIGPLFLGWEQNFLTGREV